MSQEFKIEIISPDKNIFTGNADEVTIPCFEGQVTVLKDHIPLITFLRPFFKFTLGFQPWRSLLF